MARAPAPAWRRLAMVAAVGLALYALLASAVWAGQRMLLFHPQPADPPPEAFGLERTQAITLEPEPGLRQRAWWLAPARDGLPVLLVFTGNGGMPGAHVSEFAAAEARGWGVLALAYRGYGGSDGTPSHAGFLADAEHAAAWVRARAPASPRIGWGVSLGSGVASHLAARGHLDALILEAAFTRLVDVARGIYWFLPVDLLLTERFETAPNLKAFAGPVLLAHGRADRLVPFSHFEANLAACRARTPPAARCDTFIADMGDHNDLRAFGLTDAAFDFIAGPAATPPA